MILGFVFGCIGPVIVAAMILQFPGSTGFWTDNWFLIVFPFELLLMLGEFMPAFLAVIFFIVVSLTNVALFGCVGCCIGALLEKFICKSTSSSEKTQTKIPGTQYIIRN